MGGMIDSGVLNHFEKKSMPFVLSPPIELEGPFISAVTVSELLIGVHRADSEDRKHRRSAFVEKVLAEITIVDFTTAIARTHAEISADLRKAGCLIGAHDLIIAATAVHFDFSVFTGNTGEFSRVTKLRVIPF